MAAIARAVSFFFGGIWWYICLVVHVVHVCVCGVYMCTWCITLDIYFGGAIHVFGGASGTCMCMFSGASDTCVCMW